MLFDISKAEIQVLFAAEAHCRLCSLDSRLLVGMHCRHEVRFRQYIYFFDRHVYMI